VVDKHQGSLTFENEVGRGTTFTIVLPIGPTALNPHEDSHFLEPALATAGASVQAAVT
jgi:hypothetical protein